VDEKVLVEFQTYRDLINALLWISIALISVTPLFLSLRLQLNRITNKYFSNMQAIILFVSFAFGLLSIAYIYGWFASPSPSNRIFITVWTGIQILTFSVVTLRSWPWSIGNDREDKIMSKATRIDGFYLDSQFRKVQIYVCEKTIAHHFDIPTDPNQRNDQEKKWVTTLENGNCPLC